ncbi:MAG: hypothetical protein IT181_25120 [Acidobacteria bacterium]|nr:hypothetical protein [Acidobacteriota bacterium]
MALLPLVVAGSGLAAVVLSLAGLYLWPTMLFLLWPLAALCLWPFGGQLAIAAPFVEMHVGWSPPGLSESVLLTHGTRKGGLAHSASYQDPRALDLLVAWLTRNRSETARGSG